MCSQVGEQMSLEICVSGAGETHFTRDMCFMDSGTHITRDICFLGRETHVTKDMCFVGRGTHITRDMCFLGRNCVIVSWFYITLNIKDWKCIMYVNSISLVKCVSCVGEHISLGMCVSSVGKHISPGICVSWVGETNFTGDTCFLCRGMHITRDICSNAHETRIFLGRVPEHISLSTTRDQCSWVVKHKSITRDMTVFPV